VATPPSGSISFSSSCKLPSHCCYTFRDMSFVVLSQLESFVLSSIRTLLHLLADHVILVDHIVSSVLASEDPLLLVIVSFSQLAAVSSWLLLSSSLLVSLSMASDKALLLASLSMASDKALSMDIFMSGRPLRAGLFGLTG
jgi:hypothetical protein